MNITSDGPQFVMSLRQGAWGGALVATTMVIHGFGMLAVLRVNRALKRRFAAAESHFLGLFFVILASWMILVLHLCEVMVWAQFFFWIGAFASPGTAYYFSLNEYTTLGSTLNLPVEWRLLEGMMALGGMLAFAWSTGILFSLAQDFFQQRLQWLSQQHQR
jgi:hypothetical protein